MYNYNKYLYNSAISDYPYIHTTSPQVVVDDDDDDDDDDSSDGIDTARCDIKETSHDLL
jgi:hypothetical protein